jgi:hypothetical protein
MTRTAFAFALALAILATGSGARPTSVPARDSVAHLA